MAKSQIVHRLFSVEDASFESHNATFAAVLGDAPRLEHVVDTDAHEGPVYVAQEHSLYFTSLPDGHDVAIRRLDLRSRAVTTVRTHANGANGMTLGLDGRLVVCEQGSRSAPARIARVDRATGEAETVANGWRGVPFNSPNDVVVHRNGSIWFTDPSYGFLHGFRPEPRTGDFVYRYDPSSDDVSVVAVGFDKPNGIAFSPDQLTLYVTDSGANQEENSFHDDRPHQIVAFDVTDGRHLENERVFAVTTSGFPDGIKTDTDGRVYASAFSGVHVFDPAGELIGEIRLPGAVNFVWGGPDRNILYITTDTAVWAAVLNAKGA
jgi:gluconolactonase